MDTTQHAAVPTETTEGLEGLRLVDPAEAPALAEELARRLESELDPPHGSGPTGRGDAS